MVLGDTGNMVVLISVAMSACSLLQRFTRSAMSVAGLSAAIASDEESEVDVESVGMSTGTDEEADLP